MPSDEAWPCWHTIEVHRPTWLGLPSVQKTLMTDSPPGHRPEVRQRHEHLPETTAPFPNVILDDGLPSRKAMLVVKALKYPLRRVVLLAVNRSVIFQNTVNDIRERVQPRALWWLVAAAVAWWLQMPEHLLHRVSRNANRLAAARWLSPST
jgi:hypothetical protein